MNEAIRTIGSAVALVILVVLAIWIIKTLFGVVVV